jgi:PAS domain S-box-containing protein
MGLFLLTAAIWLGSRTLLATNFLPHWYCYVGNQRLLWTNVIADFVIGLSYVAISATLVWLVRRAGRDLPYPHFFWAFGLFIVSCGAMHLLEIVTVWKPVYWLLAAVKVVTAMASAGTAAVLLIAADDIVEFVRSAREAAMRRGNEQFRALVNAAPMAVVSDDLEGKVTAWNPAAERMFGWKATEVLGRSPSLTPPGREEERNELRERTFAGLVTHGFETVRLNRAGEPIPVSFSAAPILDERGKLVSMMGVFEDISERKRIALELQEKSEIISTVTHALNTFLETNDWSTASRHLLTFAIHKTQSEYGFLGVVIEEGVLRVLAHDGMGWDMKLNRKMYEEKMLQHATQGYFEVGHRHNLVGEVINKGAPVVANCPETDPRSGGLPDGHPRLSAFLGVPIFKGRDAVGLIAVANRAGGYAERELNYLQTMSQATGVLYDSYRQNIKRNALEEEQKRLESQVRQAQKMEVLGRLAGGVAHDFNNMLMVIGGCTELLDRALPGESPARIHLDQIQRTTEKAAAVTKQLLAFSRKQVLELRLVDLHEALTQSKFMLPRLLGSDIQLTFHHDAAKSWIRSDLSQIEQVVANLAINARDAMSEGGHLAISTRNVTSLPEEGVGSPSLSGNWVVLEVSDTGCGMDEETRAQIFEPFFTTKPEGKGTGLGLATVYGIVKQSCGHIRVDSAPDKGTRFELYFPLAETQIAASPGPSPAEMAEDAGGATILVADDEATLRQVVVEILRASGYRVLEAQTAAEALEIAQEHPGQLDILLTDIVMPGLRGTELARRVTKVNPGIQVVYMSGYAEGFPEAQLPPNSVFLQKPFRFATLLEQLKLVRRRA